MKACASRWVPESPYILRTVVAAAIDLEVLSVAIGRWHSTGLALRLNLERIVWQGTSQEDGIDNCSTSINTNEIY